MVATNLLSALSDEIKHAARKAGVEGAGYSEANNETLPIVVGRVINVVLAALGVFLVGLIVYGGYIWMNARGEKEEVDKAQKIIRDAVIGLVIMFIAYGITQFVISNVLTAVVTE